MSKHFSETLRIASISLGHLVIVRFTQDQEKQAGEPPAKKRMSKAGGKREHELDLSEQVWGIPCEPCPCCPDFPLFPNAQITPGRSKNLSRSSQRRVQR